MDENKVTQEVQEPVVDDKPVEKTFTQADVDKIVGDRLARLKAKHEEELKAKVSEAEKLAKMTEEERAKAEIDIAKAELKAMREEFDRVKAEFEGQQMLAQVTKELNDRGLPISMAKSLIGVNAEATKDNIDRFENDWKASLELGIKAEIKSSSSSPRLELKGEEGVHKDPRDMSLTEFIEYNKNKK